jgi:linoleoyl-CoA desaturase
MTNLQRTDTDPTAHLSAADIARLGAELDAIRDEILASRGESDAAYIRKVIDAQRKLEFSSRAILLFSLFPPAWLAGTVGLSVSKIIENMEIGHNVMHGQWDWMRDPTIHSTSWEWDNASPSDMWKHSHNELHHTYTNVIGKDNDLGYGIMRVDEDQRWKPLYLVQPVSNAINACFFQYGIAAYDLEIARFLKGRVDKADFVNRGKKVLAKIGRHVTRDYVLHPLLSGPSALTTLTANLTANLVRNLWTHSVIMCGHFPEGVQTFAKTGKRPSINNIVEFVGVTLSINEQAIHARVRFQVLPKRHHISLHRCRLAGTYITYLRGPNTCLLFLPSVSAC